MQPQLKPVHVSLPFGDDLSSIDGKFGMSHADRLDVHHLVTDERQVLQAGHAAGFVLAQGVHAEFQAITGFHLPMIDPGRNGRQGGADG